MIELKGDITVLKTLERKHCKKLWREHEIHDELPTQQIVPGKSIEKADEWFEDIQEKQGKEQYYLGIFTKKDELVGDIQLTDINWRNRTAKMGVGIYKVKDRGKGYGSDAAKTLLRFGFDHLDLYRVSARTVEFNTAAIKLLERNNFKLEGRERAAISLEGERYDRLIYGLLRSGFVQCSKK